MATIPALELRKMGALKLPAGVLPGLTGRNPKFGVKSEMLKGDGRMTASMRASLFHNPSFDFSCACIGQAITHLCANNSDFILEFGTVSAQPVSLYMPKYGGSGIMTGNVHSKLEGNKGCIVGNKITTAQGKLASLSGEGYFLSSDGQTKPMVFTDGGVALPTLPVLDECYTLGPIVLKPVSGADIVLWDGLTDWDLDFRQKIEVPEHGGNWYPTVWICDERNPGFSLKTIDTNSMSDIGEEGLELASVTAYLRRCQDGVPLADSASKHIKFQLAGGFIEPADPAEKEAGMTDYSHKIDILEPVSSSTKLISTSLNTPIAI